MKLTSINGSKYWLKGVVCDFCDKLQSKYSRNVYHHAPNSNLMNWCCGHKPSFKSEPFDWLASLAPPVKLLLEFVVERTHLYYFCYIMKTKYEIRKQL